MERVSDEPKVRYFTDGKTMWCKDTGKFVIVVDLNFHMVLSIFAVRMMNEKERERRKMTTEIDEQQWEQVVKKVIKVLL